MRWLRKHWYLPLALVVMAIVAGGVYWRKQDAAKREADYQRQKKQYAGVGLVYGTEEHPIDEERLKERRNAEAEQIKKDAAEKNETAGTIAAAIVTAIVVALL